MEGTQLIGSKVSDGAIVPEKHHLYESGAALRFRMFAVSRRSVLMDSSDQDITPPRFLPGKRDLFYPPPLFAFLGSLRLRRCGKRSRRRVSLGATRRNKTQVNTKQDGFKAPHIRAAISDLCRGSNPSLRTPGRH